MEVGLWDCLEDVEEGEESPSTPSFRISSDDLARFCFRNVENVGRSICPSTEETSDSSSAIPTSEDDGDLCMMIFCEEKRLSSRTGEVTSAPSFVGLVVTPAGDTTDDDDIGDITWPCESALISAFDGGGGNGDIFSSRPRI